MFLYSLSCGNVLSVLTHRGFEVKGKEQLVFSKTCSKERLFLIQLDICTLFACLSGAKAYGGCLPFPALCKNPAHVCHRACTSFHNAICYHMHCITTLKLDATNQ